MSRKRRLALSAALAGLGLLLVAGVVVAATAFAQRATADGREVGNVLIGNRTVIRYRASAGGYGPYERAQISADRLNYVLRQSDNPDQFSVRRTTIGPGVYANDRLIVMATSADADAANMSAGNLAYQWRDNIILALGGRVPDRNSSGSSGYYDSWEGQAQKWVPILDVSNNGVRIGAAQVAGPRVQIDKTKAVAQLGLDFQRVARIKVYVPISSYNVIRLDRVQGVSVWATGDLRLVKF